MMLVVFGALALLLLVWSLRREHRREGLARRMRGRKMTSRISSVAQLISGGNRVPVALTLERSQIFYESDAIQARLEIATIEEVEYDSEQGTGNDILRLRTRGQSLEFVLDAASARKWAILLPAYRFGDTSLLRRLSSAPPELAARKIS
jgi:hypothetical protein